MKTTEGGGREDDWFSEREDAGERERERGKKRGSKLKKTNVKERNLREKSKREI